VRLAIFSDSHGNAFGLEAMLADLERRGGADTLVCLGDVAQGGAQPRECIELVRALGCPVVLGNADAFLLDVASAEGSREPVTARQLEVREWTLAQLAPDDLDFIRGFQPTVEVRLESGGRALCFHGSPDSFEDVILPSTPEEEVRALLADRGAALLTGGHTHLQQFRRVAGAVFLNPGSVGLAYDHEQFDDAISFDPWAEYAFVTVDGGSSAWEFRRVPFDGEAVATIGLERARPYAQEDAARWGKP
jgi:predicted phosphodiesterase